MKRIMTILAAAALSAAGCDKIGGDTTVTPADFVEVSQEYLAAGPDGQAFEISVESSETWRINGGAEWVTISAGSGKSGDKVTFTVAPNDGEETVAAEFKIFAGSAVKKISVVSSPVWYLEAHSGAKPEMFSYGGGYFELMLDTNIPAEQLEVSCSEGDEEWISCNNAIKGMKFTKMQFSVGSSELYKERDAKITVNGQEHSLEIPVSQDMRPAFFVDTESIDTDNTAQEVNFIIRTNVASFSISGDSWISSISKGEGELLEDGLTRYTCRASLSETLFSRKGEIIVTKSNPYQRIVIPVSQVNPNPLTVTINDPKFAKWLIGQGWISDSADGSDEYELVEKGTAVTQLTIGSNYGSSITDIDEISGLGGFPKLNEISIRKCSVKRIDLTGANIADYKFNIGECHELEYVNMGNYTSGFKFASWSVGDASKQWQTAETFTLVNPVPTYIDLDCSEKSMKDKEKLKILDVTGCTNLTLLYATRSAGDWCVLETIYISAEQMEKYNSEELKIYKNDKTQVVVKP